MNIFDYFIKRGRSSKTASMAKERLQIIVAHQRGKRADYLPLLHKELLEVIRRHVNVQDDQVKVELECSGDCSILELNITLPSEVTAGA